MYLFFIMRVIFVANQKGHWNTIIQFLHFFIPKKIIFRIQSKQISKNYLFGILNFVTISTKITIDINT